MSEIQLNQMSWKFLEKTFVDPNNMEKKRKQKFYRLINTHIITIQGTYNYKVSAKSLNFKIYQHTEKEFMSF